MNPQNTYLKVTTLAERFGVSRTTIWRWTRDNAEFPAPVKLSSNCVRWRLSDIEEFESKVQQ